MITAEAIIAKVVEFIVQKSATQLIKLSFDKRKKACRALTKLYYAMQALDDVTESIFRTVSDFRSTDSGEAFIVMNALNNHMYEISLASNAFIDIGLELHAGLEIIDPTLAVCCDALYISKFDFLSEMSNTVEWDRSIGSGCIIIKMPKRTTDFAALESSYMQVLDTYKQGNKHYWPNTWTSSNEPSQVILTWEDNDAAESFLKRLTAHRAILVDAKGKLRELLKANFTIEELLFQTDTRPYR